MTAPCPNIEVDDPVKGTLRLLEPSNAKGEVDWNGGPLSGPDGMRRRALVVEVNEVVGRDGNVRDCKSQAPSGSGSTPEITSRISPYGLCRPAGVAGYQIGRGLQPRHDLPGPSRANAMPPFDRG